MPGCHLILTHNYLIQGGLQYTSSAFSKLRLLTLCIIKGLYSDSHLGLFPPERESSRPEVAETTRV